uniref:Glycosyl transferase family 1 domain-containing protein n=1 Tax=viral metagenome TaxID=1070528 RepID=A0A6C0KEU9_9ZZZZ
MKKLIAGIIVVIILVVFFYNYLFVESYTAEVPTVKFPFKNTFDDQGNKLNVILLAAPFRSIEDEQNYDVYKKQNLLFCGISSYLDFPNTIHNPYEDKFHVQQNHDYISMAGAWLNCFRKPSYLQKIQSLPHMLLTEADLKDVSSVSTEKLEKEYDFLYCCLSDNDKCSPGWQSYNRNWELAQKCLEIMCRDFNLRGILVGRQNCEFSDKCDGIVKVLPFLPYNEFQTELKKCRFLFVPNISDASPRVITEAICYNMPVLVNANILGGWHNVIPSITGEFFTSDEDISESLAALIQNYHTYQPRKWYQENRGKEISGAYLAQFLINNFPNLNNKNMKYATITI